MEFTDLSPHQFENLTVDLLQVAGLKRLVWRTLGPDGGRDIEGFYTSIDFSNYYYTKRWYIECKRYSSSIDWPTVWNKIAYADARKANFLLFVTN
jgi:Restriction endonuclease